MLSTVLVVDDDSKIREMLTSILEDAGYSVETAADGNEAIKAAKKYPIDVALIDIELPDTKGTKLLSALKTIRPRMVNIIITGYPSIENAVTAVNEKADGYVFKPFNPADLLEKIKKLSADKTQEYIAMFREVEECKNNAPSVKYRDPDRWHR
jgi:DNA-binding NtrC family response regulator